MGRYHYVANNTKKEYLDCPDLCGVKIHSFLENKKHCVARLLLFKLWLDWNGDNLSFYNDNDNEDLPWDDDKSWKDITLSSIKDFNTDMEKRYQIKCKDILNKVTQ